MSCPDASEFEGNRKQARKFSGLLMKQHPQRRLCVEIQMMRSVSSSRSLKHCQRECILLHIRLNSNSGKECECVTHGREDERSRYLSVDQFTLTLHIHTSELLLLLFLCAFIIMIQLRSFILKLLG